MTEIAGFDFAYARPAPAPAAQCGYRFALGYLSNSPGKNMTPQLAQGYLAQGMQVGLVWETAANRVLSGAAGGAADGAAAEAQANALGYPKECVLFFAVDYAEPASDFPTCQAYANGFNSKTSRPVGIYGDFNVIEHFVTPGIQPVQYGWQTIAWSGGALSGKASIYQRNTHHWPIIPGLGAGDFDEDVLLKPLPLWGSGVTPPAPTPLPTPPAPTPFDVRNWHPVYGATDPHIQNLQAWGNHHYPAYCNITPTDPHYGPKTVAFVKEFAHRSGIGSADGMNIGPQTANALANAGFPG